VAHGDADVAVSPAMTWAMCGGKAIEDGVGDGYATAPAQFVAPARLSLANPMPRTQPDRRWHFQPRGGSTAPLRGHVDHQRPAAGCVPTPDSLRTDRGGSSRRRGRGEGHKSSATPASGTDHAVAAYAERPDDKACGDAPGAATHRARRGGARPSKVRAARPVRGRMRSGHPTSIAPQRTSRLGRRHI